MPVWKRVVPRGSAWLGPLVSLSLLACDKIVPRVVTLPADTSTAATVHTAMPATSKAKAPATPESASFADVRAWLRRLVVAEETYFAETGTYTAALKSTRLQPPADVTTTMLWATRDGWAARARRADIPGRDCVVYVGTSQPAPATMKYRRQAREGVPICDEVDAVKLAALSRRTRRTLTADPPAEPPADPVADTVSGLDIAGPIVQMKVDLRNLAWSQDLWHATQGAYSRRLELLNVQYLGHRGVKLRITSANGTAWSATATHDALPGKSCVIWVGPVATAPRTDGQGRQTDRAAVPVCDDPS